MTALCLVVGVLAGLHAATWGAFKDTPFEGFRWRSFLRSVALGPAVSLALFSGLPGAASQPVLVLVGLVYAGERLATEWWKAFLREDHQSAYTIPMRWAVRGRTVDARLPRYLTGLGVLAVLLLMADWVPALVRATSTGWLTVLVGGLGGWLTAVGGAWKDAPVEGFEAWKFLRSPAVATAWAVVLLPLTRDPLTLSVSAAGLSVLAIETYKSFLTGGRPPGKFHGKPVRYAGSPARDRVRVLHCLVHGLLAGAVLRAPVAAVPVAATVGVAMLVTGHRSTVVVGTVAQEPDVDVALRRERA